MNTVYKIKKTSPSERKDLVVQEFTSQAITTLCYSISFLLGGMIAHRFLPKVNPKIFYKGSSASKNGETLASLIGGVLGGAFIMSFLSAEAVSKFKENKSDQGSSETESARKNQNLEKLMPSQKQNTMNMLFSSHTYPYSFTF